MTDVSVVIPTRNRCGLLSRTLACVLAQDHAALQVLVVDDGSTDGTRQYLSSLADTRVTALAGGGQGAAHARNVGVRAAEGSWIAFLDDDDVWSRRKLSAQLSAVTDRNADAVFSGAVVVDTDLHPTQGLWTQPLDELAADMTEYNAVPAGASNVLARAELVAACDGFDEGLNAFADWDMWVRLIRAGGVFAAVAEVLVGYLHHGGAMSVGAMPAMRRELDLLQAKHGGWAREVSGERIGGERFWRWYEASARRAGDRASAARILAYRAVRFRQPSDLMRAAVMATLGERGMAWFADRTGPVRPPAPPAPSPQWLDDIRAGRWPPPARSAGEG